MRNTESISGYTNAGTRLHPIPAMVRGRFADFDEFTESTVGWDIDFRQVGKGSLSAELLQLLDPQLAISKVKFNRCCLQSGASPVGMRTFAILDNGAPETKFCGEAFSVNTIALFSKNDEFESTSPPGFAVFTLSIEESWFSQLVELAGQRLPHELLPDSAALLPCRPGGLDHLRTRLNRLQSLMNSAGTEKTNPQTLERVKQDIAANLLHLIEDPGQTGWTHARLQRHALLRQAKEFIMEHLADPVRVQDVAAALGVTVRTIELMFRELLDMTPHAYIITTRLYAVHRALKDAEPEKSVGGIAGQWGFWHMGQFARDYRARFGELPSRTLAR